MLLFTVAVRVRLLDVPLERDEGEYAYAGQLILEGVPPYRLAYNMKLPGTYAAYAVILAVFGQTPRGIHLGLLLVNLLTSAILFLLARRLFDEAVAAAAAGTFAVLSLSQGVLGVFAHATHFVLLPALAGTLVLLRALETRSLPALFASGLLLGTAFVMKQHGVLFVAFGLLWTLWESARRREPATRLAASAAWFLAGAAIPFALTCVVLAWAGVLKSFWFWTIDYARAYVTEVPPAQGARLLAETAASVAAPTWPLWVLAGAGALAPLWDEPARRHGRFTTLFLLASFLAICPGFYFREHYFVLLLPAAALLAAIGASALARALAARLSPGPGEARDTCGANPFPEAMEIARRIAGDSRPEDRVAILGSEPEIFFYAHRRSATGHIYMYGLMEEQPYARRMQQEAIREIEAQAPLYIVFVNVPQSWLGRPGSDTTILTWSRPYLEEHYRVAGVADIQSSDRTVYAWGEEALSYAPQSPFVVYLFKRIS